MTDDPLDDDTLPDESAAGETLRVRVPDDTPSARLDKTLAPLVEPLGLSRSRLRALIEAGHVARLTGGRRDILRDASAKLRGAAVFEITVLPPVPARPGAEAIPLDVVFEDADIVVVNKPPGMVVHPAPGAWTGTLVNALLAHCGDSLSGIGGERRPGIVHRIDKDTSGLLVVAKSDMAHRGLAAQFAAHDLERSYQALVWGHPSRADARLAGLPAVAFEPGWVRVETTIGRSRGDRKKMAVNVADGRRAVTRFRVTGRAGPCAVLECRLETGRTHQIRVHLTHLGHPLVGDPVYGRARTAPATLPDATREALATFPRQALHAATLGFVHPATGETMRFETPMPDDMRALIEAL